MRFIKQEQYFPVLIFVHFVFWGVDILAYQGDYKFNAQHILGEVFSSWLVTAFAINFLMSTKARWVESIFGGLDKMYMIHRRAGIFAVCLIVLHFISIPKTTEFAIGKPLGLLSFIGILISVLIAALPIFKRILKYNKWLNIHKWIGVFYILGVVHSVTVPTLTAELPIVRVYVIFMSLVGIFSWVYKTFLFSLFNKKYKYEIVNVTNFKNDITELQLVPEAENLVFTAGQFAFLSIEDVFGRESHPFTISSSPRDNRLRFTIKSLGDYTAELQSLKLNGYKATLQGPYGNFDYTTAEYKNQLWLAGGIGITPFLSFLNEVELGYDITLVWSVKSIEEANYLDEIVKTINRNMNIKFVLWDSDKKGRFSISSLYNSNLIKNHSVFICGGEIMREAYIKQLIEKGVHISQIHYEEFSFR